MMHALPCHRVREDLEAFVDGELGIDQQVVIQSHLESCVPCRLAASELAEIGHALRATPVGPSQGPEESGRLTSIVLERVRLEHQLSLGMQLRDIFADMHFVWAGLGATAAMLICIIVSASALQAASPGSNANPVALHDDIAVPRAEFDATVPLPVEDTELAFAAVVTREGRIQNLELVHEQARALHVKPEVVLSMLNAAARTRFEPAKADGEPVAVSMLWLLSTTTVKGRPDYDMYLLKPPVINHPALGPLAPPKPRPVPTPVKPAPTSDAALAG
jgi:putative zinc finger protein